MFGQILVSREHCDYQRVLWQPIENGPICEYRIQTLVYGMTSNPFPAIRTLQQLVDDERDRHTTAAKILKTCSYVDDLLFGPEVSVQLQRLRINFN